MREWELDARGDLWRAASSPSENSFWQRRVTITINLASSLANAANASIIQRRRGCRENQLACGHIVSSPWLRRNRYQIGVTGFALNGRGLVTIFRILFPDLRPILALLAASRSNCMYIVAHTFICTWSDYIYRLIPVFFYFVFRFAFFIFFPVFFFFFFFISKQSRVQRFESPFAVWTWNLTLGSSTIEAWNFHQRHSSSELYNRHELSFTHFHL